jgi:uncharacterized surface protein with fasciclin (FAS1) repeats
MRNEAMKTTPIKAMMAAAMLSAGVGALATAPALAQNSGHMGSSQMMSSGHMGQEKTVMVGGAPMSPSKTIVENASKAKNLTTLVAAVKEAGLVETLSGKGPFTVFAPTNQAFSALPKGTVDTLMKPDNKDKLKKTLTYHVVAGTHTAKDLMAAVKSGGGTAKLKTVEGEDLTVSEKGNKLYVTDAKGNAVEIMTADVMQSNGVVHVIGHVLMPG